MKATESKEFLCGCSEDKPCSDHEMKGTKMDQVSYIQCAVELPPNGQIVATKIDDAKGCRNEDVLLWRQNNLWFVPDGSMYVYYSPTHWRPATVEELRKERLKFASAAVGANTRLAEFDAAITSAEGKPQKSGDEAKQESACETKG